VFAPGPMPGPVNFRGVRLGVPICEDIWGTDVVETLAETGAELLIVPNGSPYWRDKETTRLNIAVARVTESDLPIIYVNEVGGQDELVFDGASFGLHADCSLAFQLPAFRESVTTVRWQRTGNGWRCLDGPMAKPGESDQDDYSACVLGLRDYVDKNGFPGVVLGLSGGVDSALCAAIAVDALGPQRVRCVMLPYRYTSQESRDDAAFVAQALGVHYDLVPIESAVLGLEAALAPLFAGRPRNVTEENLQARARGTILMAISNKFGLMVVTTGNKSEMSVGYATLYGDMNGGFNPIKDLYKTEVFRLSRLRNLWKPEGALGPDGPIIPENVLTRAPSAELRENQTDQDTLPPYDVLDQILERLVERDEPLASIVAAGFDRETVMKVDRMLALAEYKRRQAAPGVKVTLKNFGRDRRYPITSRFRDPGTAPPAPDRTLLKSPVTAKAGAADF
jgi:NAD+ synthase